jgi:enoyl-CoA hydratase
VTDWNVTAENEHAFISEKDGVITVVLNRPDKLNAVSAPITDFLWRGAEELVARDDLSVMVITGVGKYFTAGIDLKTGPVGRIGDKPMPPERSSKWRRAYRNHHLLYDEFESIEKPIILAAQGPCLGAGVEMACSVDIRLGSDTSVWGLPEIHLGVIAGSGGTSRLTRLVGPHWSKWIGMFDQRVDAETARMIGLVHQVMPAEGFHEAVQEFAAKIALLPREGMAVAKLVIDACVDLPRDSARHIERLVNTPLPIEGEGEAYRARFAH